MTTRGLESFVAVGFSFRELPGPLRGRLAFDDAWCDSLVGQLRGLGAATGAVFLHTCNRNEVILTSPTPTFAVDLVRTQLVDLLGDVGTVYEPFRHVGADAVRHVLEVASSLDSMAVGEHEIAQQLRRAFEKARSKGWLDKRLNGLAGIALEASREVHKALSGPPTGIFTLAANAVRAHVGEGRAGRVAVWGLGDIGRRTAWTLVEAGHEVVLSTRTPRSAESLGARLSAIRAVPWSDRHALVGEVDVVVVATGAPGHTLGHPQFRSVRDASRLLVIDLGIPPQVDAEATVEAGARLVDVDDLGRDHNPSGRSVEELRRASALVDSAMTRLSEWLLVREHAPAFARLRSVSEQFRAAEIERLMADELAPFLQPGTEDAVREHVHELLNRYADSLFVALKDTLGREHESLS